MSVSHTGCHSGDDADREGDPRDLRGHVLLTGATGFVGQALLERLLSDHPDTHIDVLLRPTPEADAAARLRELIARPAFTAWRERVGAAGVAAEVGARVTALPGDLADAATLLAERPPYDLVVHAAGNVSFRPPLTEAFATNVDGVEALYSALREQAAGGTGTASGGPATPHVVHVSTAYVWTDRAAVGLETRLPHDVDWRAERRETTRIAAALAQAVAARRVFEAASRRSGAAGTAAGGAAAVASRGPGGAATPDGAAPAPGGSDDEAVRAKLAEAGLSRARSLGWTDVYTYTKALGERVAEELCAPFPLTVVRPTIIESALSRPFPGWLDGFKVADPMIVAYARGRLPAFPGAPELILDIVPVDIVVNAVLAAARQAPPPGRPTYLHAGTSRTNPLRLGELRRQAEDYFNADPWIERDGTAVRPRPFRFVPSATMWARLDRAARVLDQLRGIARRLPGPAGAAARIRVAVQARRLATVREFVTLYEPYTCSPTTYDDAALRALDRGRPEEERRAEPLDVTGWRWEDYLGGIHLPAVQALMARRRSAGTKAPATPSGADAPIPATAPPATPADSADRGAAPAAVTGHTAPNPR